MPTRMIRDWTDSQRFDGIDAEAERLFIRIIMKADDYGRFHGDPRLVASACFPMGDRTAATIEPVIDTLVARGLVLRYTVAGRIYIAIPNYGQRLKQSRAKFPAMDGKDGKWLPIHSDFQTVPGSSGKFPPEVEGEVEGEAEPLPLSGGGGLATMIAMIRQSRPEYANLRESDLYNVLTTCPKVALERVVKEWCADQSNALEPLKVPLASLRKRVAAVAGGDGKKGTGLVNTWHDPNPDADMRKAF